MRRWSFSISWWRTISDLTSSEEKQVEKVDLAAKGAADEWMCDNWIALSLK